MDSKLLCKIVQRVKAVAGIESFLVFPVAALHLAVVSGGIGTDKLVSDTQFSGSGFKQSGDVLLSVGKAVGELKAVVRLNALHPDAPAGVPLDQPFEEVSGGIGGLLRVSRQEAQTCEFVDGSILEQTQFRVSNTPA